MTISVPLCSKAFLGLLSITLFTCLCGSAGITRAANPSAPVLISDSTSTRAISLESVTLKGGPFPLTSTVKFSDDNRTRIAIFAMNLNLLAGETANGNPSSFTADAEDAAHVHYPLNVEYVD